MVAAAIGAGVLVPAAAALGSPLGSPRQGSPLPTPTLPTVTVPTISVPIAPPTVSVPTVPIPAPPTTAVPTPTVPTPTVPTPAPPRFTTAPPSGPLLASKASSSTATTAATVQSSGRSTSSAPRSGHGGHSANRGAGRHPSRLRPRIARFRLAHAGRVRVTVWQLAPRCRFVGRFVLRADRGANVLRLPRRISKHRLGVGTYRFVGVSRGTKVLDTRFGLLRAKERLLIRRHGLVVDACAAAAIFGGSAQGPVEPFASPVQPRLLPPPRPTSAPANRNFVPSFLPPVLRALNPATASPLVRAILFALLGCAIALLAAATLPERVVAAAPGSPFVARHRATVTLGGFTLLVAAALLILLV